MVRNIPFARLGDSILELDRSRKEVLDLDAEKIPFPLLGDVDFSLFLGKLDDALDGIVDGIAENKVKFIGRDIGELVSVDKAGQNYVVCLEEGLLAGKDDVDSLVSGTDGRIVDIDGLDGFVDLLLAHLSLDGRKLVLEIVALDVDEVDGTLLGFEFLFLLHNHAIELIVLRRDFLGLVHAEKTEESKEGKHGGSDIDEIVEFLAARTSIRKRRKNIADKLHGIGTVEIIQSDEDEGDNNLSRLVLGIVSTRWIHLADHKEIETSADHNEASHGKEDTKKDPASVVLRQIDLDFIVDDSSPNMLDTISGDAAINRAQNRLPEAKEAVGRT